MVRKRKGTRAYITEAAKQLIMERALKRPLMQRTELAEKLQVEFDQKGWQVPELEVLERKISAHRQEQAADPLEKPWNLGISPPEIPLDATGDLLAVLKESLKNDHRFTIREAIWAARLRTALAGERPMVLLKWSAIYAGRETYWARERKDAPLDTSDMDAELAFMHWKSSVHDWEYDTAVLTGIVVNRLPRTHSELFGEGIAKVFTEPFGFPSNSLQDAQNLLREVAPMEVPPPAWWDQAETILAFWIGEIRKKVKKWEWVGYIDEEQLGLKPGDVKPGGVEEWEDLTRRLARAVVERARELDRWDRKWKATRGERERRYKKIKRLRKDARRAYEENKFRALRSLHEQIEALEHQTREDFAGFDSELLSSGWRPTDILKELGYEE